MLAVCSNNSKHLNLPGFKLRRPILPIEISSSKLTPVCHQTSWCMGHVTGLAVHLIVSVFLIPEKVGADYNSLGQFHFLLS